MDLNLNTIQLFILVYTDSMPNISLLGEVLHKLFIQHHIFNVKCVHLQS